jgi:hypothetical protein
LPQENYRTGEGSTVWAFECGQHSRSNEFWELRHPLPNPGQTLGVIQSLQPETPFCVGIKGSATTAGATTVLDSCTAASSAFTVGFTNTSGSGGAIVQRASGLCLTMADAPKPGHHGHGYQPMKKQGAIILATGGDNSNSARGNFYEGFMATGYASEATDAAIQANIVAVGYSGWSSPTSGADL